MASARQYITVLQDPGGYPAPGSVREDAPPILPELMLVVKADDYAELETDRDRLLASCAAALERVQVEDHVEAELILSAVVNLDGTPNNVGGTA